MLLNKIKMKNNINNKLGLGALLLASGLTINSGIVSADDGLTVRSGHAQFENVYNMDPLNLGINFTYAVNPEKDLLIVSSNLEGSGSIVLSYSGFKKEVLGSLGVGQTEVAEGKRVSSYNFGSSAKSLVRMFAEDSLVSNQQLINFTAKLAEKSVESKYISEHFFKSVSSGDQRFRVDNRLTSFDEDGKSNLDKNHQITNPNRSVSNPSAGYENNHYVVRVSQSILDLNARTTQSNLEKLLVFSNKALKDNAGNEAVQFQYDSVAAKQFRNVKVDMGKGKLAPNFVLGRQAIKTLVEAALVSGPGTRAENALNGLSKGIEVGESIYANTRNLGGRN